MQQDLSVDLPSKSDNVNTVIINSGHATTHSSLAPWKFLASKLILPVALRLSSFKDGFFHDIQLTFWILSVWTANCRRYKIVDFARHLPQLTQYPRRHMRNWFYFPKADMESTKLREICIFSNPKRHYLVFDSKTYLYASVYAMYKRDI